jgi:hypothetical protein
MNNAEDFNQDAVNEYHDQTSNRAQAIALLNKLKAKEAGGMAVSKVYWKDGQPTLIESSSRLNWDSKLMPYGRPENKGLPATDSNPRVPAGWESKMDRKRRRQYTLAETQTMQTPSSGMLPGEYYADEEQVEAYIESLQKEMENDK